MCLVMVLCLMKISFNRLNLVKEMLGYPDVKVLETATGSLVKINGKDILMFGFPSVLKASNGGSSKEVVILKSEKDLKNTKKLLNSGRPLLIEKYLPGIEVTIAILQNRPLPVLEIIPPKGKWFNYRYKYSGETKEIPFAPSIGKNLQELVQTIALKIHKTLEIKPCLS